MSFKYDCQTNTLIGNSKTSDKLGQVMWHVTDECCLSCAFCFAKGMKNGIKLKKEDIALQTKLLKRLGVKKIDISGGEPLLFDNLEYLAEKCLENGIYITITTSGFGTERNINWLISNWTKFTRIILSLDGCEDIHNKLRGSSLAYQKFMDLYDKLKKVECNIIRINTVVTKYLINPENKNKLCRSISTLNPKEWCLIEPYGINKQDQFDNLSVDSSVFFDIFRQCNQIIKDIHIEYRLNQDYSSYWALYPDGYLYYSNNMQCYDTKLQLTLDNLLNIKNTVYCKVQHYIKEKNMKNSKIIIENNTVDTISSTMLNSLIRKLKSMNDDISHVSEKTIAVPNQKCELTLLTEILLAVSSGLTTNILYDLLKGIYSKCKHPHGYEWNVTINIDGNNNSVVIKDNIIKIESK